MRRQHKCRAQATSRRAQPHVGTLRMSCMHCFPQCIRPIHSAHKKEPQPNIPPAAVRNSGVRRQSAARGSRSSEQPPLAASLPAKDVGISVRVCKKTHRHNVPNTHCPTVQSPDGVSDAQASQSPSALSFLLFGSSLPNRRRRVVTALPRRIAQSLSTYRRSCSNLRSKHRWRFRTSPTQATLPLYGFSRF